MIMMQKYSFAFETANQKVFFYLFQSCQYDLNIYFLMSCLWFYLLYQVKELRLLMSVILASPIQNRELKTIKLIFYEI